jgi:hypothetical protein
MRGCIIALVGFVFVMISIIRWFEQITDAVDRRQWSRVMILLVMPLTAWLFPSKVSAGRPTAVPHHEPVRGFGSVPLMPNDAPKGAAPLPRKKAKSGIDPAAIAKLKQKMKEQGMLNDDSDSET